MIHREGSDREGLNTTPGSTFGLACAGPLRKVDFHRQVAIATGSKLVFMAGQVAWDADGNLVGKGDLAAQVEQCYLNVAAAVAEAGGTFDNVAKPRRRTIHTRPPR